MEPETQAAEATAPQDTQTEPLDAPVVPSEPATAPARVEPPKFRLINRESIVVPVPLTVEERAAIGDRIGDLGRHLRQLEREHDEKNVAARAEAKVRREDIQDAQGVLDNALEAQTTGVEKRSFACERRAMIASATIELVRLDTGEVVETRAMNEVEQAKFCRQGDITDVTGGATIPSRQEPGEPVPASVPASRVEAGESEDAEDEEPSTTLDEGEAEALGLPVGWPKAWRGREWKVGDAVLREHDVHDIWLRLADAGSTIEQVLEGDAAVVGVSSWLSRKQVARALALLKQRGFAAKNDDGLWVPLEWHNLDLGEESEPGRADPLPEAGDITRPRLAEPATKADALLADAGDAATTWAM